MKLENKILELISTLDKDCQEIKDMIQLRIESSSPEDCKEENLYDVESLDVIFEDTEMIQFHAYDLGRLEAFKEIIRELKRIAHD